MSSIHRSQDIGAVTRVHFPNKAVSEPRESLDVPWSLCGIVECIADLLDRAVEALVKVNECVCRP
jgi:hypothetical protein